MIKNNSNFVSETEVRNSIKDFLLKRRDFMNILEDEYYKDEKSSLFEEIQEDVYSRVKNLITIEIPQEDLEKVKKITKVRKKNEENHKSIKPNIFYMTNDKISNDLTKKLSSDLINGDTELSEYNVGKSGKQVYTLVSIDFNKNDAALNYSGAEPLTEFDRIVHDAVTTLMVANNIILTPVMIYHVMSGKSKVKVLQKTQEKISYSIEKLRKTKLYIDRSKETGREKDILDDFLIVCRKRYVKLNGQELEAYEMSRMPLLYEYANFKKQVISTPIEILDVPLNNTDDIIVLKSYLIRRIEQIKNPKNKLRNTICYNTILEQIGKSDSSTKVRSVNRKHIMTILNYFKKTNFIKKYEEIKQGKKYYSIKIN